MIDAEGLRVAIAAAIEAMEEVAAQLPEPELPAPEPQRAVGAVRTLTVRLPETVHDQLRELAFHSRRSQHSLAMEGLNCLFERNGKPPIAPV